MKASALSFVVLGHVLLSACGPGSAGPRDSDSQPNGGSPSGLAGSSIVAGSASGSSASSSGSSAGGFAPSAGSAGGPSGPEPCGPAWMPNTAYAKGDVVFYKGGYYVAEYENPGYDPIISSYYWEPYACQGGGSAGSGSLGGSGAGGTGAGGNGPLGDSSFDEIVSEAVFNQMFPDRNNFYSYQGLVEATRQYVDFAGTGSLEQRKREAAAFLANVARETGKLVYIEQIQQDVYCSPTQQCPCEPGKQYYGRGPIQISWNYNYCAAGVALGLDLREKPELVAQNATIAWETGLWFWMTQQGAGTYTPHSGIVDGHGFGETIRSINGSQECNGAWSEAVSARVDFYQQFCNLLGVAPGENLQC